jgi:hypothetical protein
MLHWDGKNKKYVLISPEKHLKKRVFVQERLDPLA